MINTVAELRRAANSIFLAADQPVAGEISTVLVKGATEIERLRKIIYDVSQFDCVDWPDELCDRVDAVNANAHEPSDALDAARYRFIRQSESTLAPEHEKEFAEMWADIYQKNTSEFMDRRIDQAMHALGDPREAVGVILKSEASHGD